jgi:RHS repeat-associated protein
MAADVANAANSPPAMIVPGQFNVSATGAASYSIPIAVPPGSGGMAPALSLQYSSQSGDGIEGLGWTLGGLPSISRCPRTLAQDTVHGSVNYDSNDKLCMEGQRLVYVSGGSGYGTDGAIYHTEIESFSKVLEHNGMNTTNVWFEVWTKSGQHMEFGNTTDSAILTVGLSTNVIRAWAVDKISDTVSNYLTVTYNCAAVSGSCTDTNRTTNGEAYPVEIDYTGNVSASVSPYNSVKFSYGSRSDANPIYQAGASVTTTVLLTDIKTYQGANLVHDYQLAYRAGSSVTHSRMTSVTLCDNAGHCLNPTTFNWQGGTGYETPNTPVANSLAQGIFAIPGTYNGDGITDLLPMPRNDSCPASYNAYGGPGFSSSNVVGTFTNYATGGSYINCTYYPQTQTIIAPNGASQIVLPQTAYDGTTYSSFANILNSTGNPTGGPTLFLGLGPVAPPTFAADFNGDGLTDLLVQLNPNSKLYLNSTGGWLSPTTIGGLNPATTSVATADFDGDGCADIYAQTGSSATITYSCNPAVSTSTVSIASGYVPVFGDFNGDGKTDILFVSQSGAATLWLSTGTGFTEVNPSVASGSTGSSDWGKYVVYVGDWNGDGKADILLIAPGTSGYYGAGTSHKFYISTGTDLTPAVDSSSSPITISNSANTAGAVVADWNNDGASDIWLQQSINLGSAGDQIYTFSFTPELITSISNGIGSNTVVSYQPINTGSPLYTKSTSGVYPTQNINGPFYVVSQVDASSGLGTCTSPGGASCYTSKYAYAGARTDLQGRGFLGFATVAITDLQTSVVQTTTYITGCRPISSSCNDFPYTGLVASQTKTHSGTTLNATTNTYSTGTGCGSTVSPVTGVSFVCLTQSVVVGNDLNGTAFPGITTTYTYDNYGNALTINVSVSDGSSKNTTNTYSNDATNWFLGRLLTTQVHSIVGSSDMTRQSSFAYSPTTGLLTQESVAPGVSTCNSGSSSCELDTSYTYDAFGHRITTTISGTGITTRTSYAFYDSNGEFMTSAANALGQYEFWAYDPRFGKPTSHTGPNFLTTTWAYDSFGRVTQEVRPDGTQTNSSYAYCSGSCPTYGQFYSRIEIDASGGSPQIGPIGYAYFDMLSRGIANDAQGFSGANIRVATVYDANGRIQQTSRPYFTGSASPAWTQFTYDDLGRVTQATFPDSSHTSYGFNGLTTSVTNNLSQTTTTVKNAQGLNYQVTDASSHTTSYIYDAFGDTLTVTDPAGNVVTNSFDIRGNKVVSVDPDMGRWTYAYDVLAELTSQTDAKSQTTSLTYDVLGRPLTRTENDLYGAWTYGTSATNHNVGQIAEAKACPTSACSSIVSDKTYLFDGVGRESLFTLQTATDYYGYYTTYNTGNGQIASIKYPSGYTVNRSYNSIGFLTQLSEAGSNLPIWTINSRDAELHVTSQTAGNNVTTTQAFDPNTGLIQNQRAGGGSVASFDYSFDTIGNLTARTDNSQPYTERFCYDSLNRLTNYNIGAACTGDTTVGYDTIGNITAKTGTGTYNYGSRPHAVSSITGTVDGLTNPSYTYDANGNLTCTSSGSGCSGTIGRNLNLTSFNMASSLIQGSNSLNLIYDDQHQRLQQTNTVSGTATTKTVYLNDAASGAISERVTASGTTPTVWHSFNWGAAPWGGVTANALPTFTDYITIDGQIVAQRKVTYPLASAWGLQNWNGFNWGAPAGSLWGSTAGANPPRFKWGTDPWSGNVVVWNYFNLDHLGSVAVITDQGGNVVQRLSFDPWGKQRNANGTSAACGTITASTTRGFTGQEEIPAQCLVNLNARLYDTSIGKFMAPDPIVGAPYAPNAFNRYAYVLNNPLSFTDPSGLCFLGCFWNSPIFRDILAIAAAVTAQYEYLAIEEGTTFTAATFAAATTSQAATAAVIGGVVGGGISTGTVKGALLGGFQAGLFYGAGSLLNAEGISSVFGSHTADTFVAHGLVGGITSVAGGGNFGSGFLAAGVGSLADNPALDTGNFEANVVEHAVFGGIGSELGGGKFGNGAVTGAFGYLFNNCLHTTGGCWKTFKEDARMTLDWASGTGPAMRSFGPDTDQTQDMQGAPGVEAARDFFYNKNAAALASGQYDELQGVTNYRASFGLTGYLGAYADLSPTEHFVGSYSVDITINYMNLLTGPRYFLTFTLTNNSSLQSFLYGVPVAHERSFIAPTGNMRQTYTWSEPLRH